LDWLRYDGVRGHTLKVAKDVAHYFVTLLSRPSSVELTYEI